MADKSVSVNVKGLAELSRAFKQLEGDIPVKLRPYLLRVSKTIASHIQSKLPATFKPAIKARATQRGAGVAFPGGEARSSVLDAYPWFDFGGTTGRGHRIGQRFSGSISREWMGKPVGEGRFVYPTIREDRAEIEDALDDALQAAIKAAGFDTKGSLI